jgi:hypothetical protein
MEEGVYWDWLAQPEQEDVREAQAQDAMAVFDVMENIVEGAKAKGRARMATWALVLQLSCEDCADMKWSIFEILWPKEGS